MLNQKSPCCPWMLFPLQFTILGVVDRVASRACPLLMFPLQFTLGEWGDGETPVRWLRDSESLFTYFLSLLPTLCTLYPAHELPQKIEGKIIIIKIYYYSLPRQSLVSLFFFRNIRHRFCLELGEIIIQNWSSFVWPHGPALHVKIQAKSGLPSAFRLFVRHKPLALCQEWESLGYDRCRQLNNVLYELHPFRHNQVLD